MEEKIKHSYEQYKDSFNYFNAISLAALGAIAGIALWLVLVSMNQFFSFVPLLLGAFPSAGARHKQPKGQFISMIIAIIVIIPSLFIADFMETAIIRGSFGLSIDQYWAAFLAKFADRFILYIGAITFPIAFEYGMRRAEERGEA